MMTRLRLGHCGLAWDLARMGKHADGLCECGVGETVKHVLMECKRYNRERTELFSEVMRVGEPVVSLRVLLGYGDHQFEVAGAVVNFMYATG